MKIGATIMCSEKSTSERLSGLGGRARNYAPLCPQLIGRYVPEIGGATQRMTQLRLPNLKVVTSRTDAHISIPRRYSNQSNEP